MNIIKHFGHAQSVFKGVRSIVQHQAGIYPQRYIPLRLYMPIRAFVIST